MKDEGQAGDPSPSRLKRWFGSHPFRTILRIAAAIAGAGLIAGGLGVIWPKPARGWSVMMVVVSRPIDGGGEE